MGLATRSKRMRANHQDGQPDYTLQEWKPPQAVVALSWPMVASSSTFCRANSYNMDISLHSVSGLLIKFLVSGNLALFGRPGGAGHGQQSDGGGCQVSGLLSLGSSGSGQGLPRGLHHRRGHSGHDLPGCLHPGCDQPLHHGRHHLGHRRQVDWPPSRPSPPAHGSRVILGASPFQTQLVQNNDI